MRDVRREIARVNTLLQEHEQGLRMLPGGVATEGAVATKGAKDE
jgi:hypothetical protein